jgi:metallo-beta-lactamase family protein
MSGNGVTITFLGAAETVTGSRYLVEAEGIRVLVDCGLFQGWKKLRERNWATPRFDPSSLDAVLFTHAHIDHTGYFPKLCALGYSGSAYCTAGTGDLLQILLPDSGYLQEEEAYHANKWRYSKHRPALPLYTRDDAISSLSQLKTVPFYERFEPCKGVSAKFSRAGHIVGSACLHLEIAGITITFTGDVGRPVDPIMKPPDTLEATDFLVTESTYGDRRHPDEDVFGAIESIVNDTVDKKGVILVPSFAVGRSQHLLRIVSVLKEQKRIPDIPVFLDSPMAISATAIFKAHREDHRLSDEETERMCDVTSYSRTPDDSKAIDRSSGPMIVISASGMATGGRILHHLEHFLPGERNTVLFVGYQAVGTRGRSLVDGSDEIKLHGHYVPVRARVTEVRGLSAHADYREMLDWLERGSLSPKRVFVTHGEPAAADAFRRRLKDRFHWDAVIPEDGSTWKLELK